jgi:hypothetical protein
VGVRQTAGLRTGQWRQLFFFRRRAGKKLPHKERERRADDGAG